jgi:hypothetical protein
MTDLSATYVSFLRCTTVSEELELSLGPIADLLESTSDTVAAMSQRADAWKVKEETPWWLAARSSNDGPSGPWSSNEHQIAVGISSLYLVGATAHLLNLGILYRNDGHHLSPELLVRAIVELSLRMEWLLSVESTDRGRAARGHLERLHGHQSSLRAAKRLGNGGDQSHYSKIKQARKEALAEVQHVFYDHEIAIDLGKDSTEWILSGEKLPGPALLAARFGEITDMGERTGEGVYDFLSGYTHPNALELHLRMADVAPSGEFAQSRALRADADYMKNLATAALSAFYIGFRLIVTYVGWDQHAFADWESKYRSVLS